MTPTRPTTRLPAVVLFACLAVAASPGAALHFGLAKSVPAAGAVVGEVAGVTLWFTEAPAAGTVSIRMVDATGEPVSSGDPAQAPSDAKAFSIELSTAPSPGKYTVAWRGMGSDGHVVRGDFSFVVAGSADR